MWTPPTFLICPHLPTYIYARDNRNAHFTKVFVTTPKPLRVAGTAKRPITPDRAISRGQ